MLKRLLERDTIATGLLLGLGAIIATAALLTLGLLVAGPPLGSHLRWYAACFVPPLLLLRYVIKLQRITITKTLIITLFLTFIPFMAYLIRSNNLLIQ